MKNYIPENFKFKFNVNKNTNFNVFLKYLFENPYYIINS